MNNKGDFYIGNQKKSSLTGEEVTFDTPIPSVAGEDPARLSVVFDEVTIKERLVVEGGRSNTSLSQFDGPVTFNNETQFKDIVKIKDSTDSTSPSTGALLISGGVGFAKTAHFADDAKLKFGDGSDLNIFHDGSESFIHDDGTGGLVFLTGSSPIEFRVNATPSKKMLLATPQSSVELYYDGSKKFETLGVGGTTGAAVAYGDMYATAFYGDGSTLDNIDATALKDSNDNIIAQAVSTGLNVTGTLSATSTADATPAIIATNTGGLNSIIQRWVGDSESLEVQQPNASGQYKIVNTKRNHGIRFYDDTNGIILLFDDQLRLQVLDTAIQIGDVNATDIDLNVTGDITAFFSSDIRLKENISPITKALEKVKSISGNTYTKKSDGSAHTGVIAQEIEALGLPGITTTRSSGYMAVDYEKIVPLLIEAIKELSAKVDTLENQINN
jgi:hypothetical protein